ncbi:hypothetical protein O6H91_09G002300 [Diphasiastrum complanatum]|nr:hypothetical protein O6H91_09G002300 [Diphasiastrum complanatum]
MQERLMGPWEMDRQRDWKDMQCLATCTSSAELGLNRNAGKREDPTQHELDSLMARNRGEPGNRNSEIEHSHTELDEHRFGNTEFSMSSIHKRKSVASMASTSPLVENFAGWNSSLSKAIDSPKTCMHHQWVEAGDSSQSGTPDFTAEGTAINEGKSYASSETGDQTRLDPTQGTMLISFKRHDISSLSPSSIPARFESSTSRDYEAQNRIKVHGSSSVHTVELQDTELEARKLSRRAFNSSKNFSLQCSNSLLFQQKTSKESSKHFSVSGQSEKERETGFDHQAKSKLDYGANKHPEDMLFEVCSQVTKTEDTNVEDFHKKSLATQVAYTDSGERFEDMDPIGVQFTKANAAYDLPDDQATDSNKYIALYVLAQVAVQAADEQENSGIMQPNCIRVNMHSESLKGKAVFLGGAAPRTSICTPRMSKRSVYMHVGESMQVSVQQTTHSRCVNSSAKFGPCGSKVQENFEKYKATFIHGSIPFAQRHSTRRSRQKNFKAEMYKLGLDVPRANAPVCSNIGEGIKLTGQKLSSNCDAGYKHVATAPTAEHLLKKLKCQSSQTEQPKRTKPPKKLGDFTLESPKKRQRKPSVRLLDL